MGGYATRPQPQIPLFLWRLDQSEEGTTLTLPPYNGGFFFKE